MRRYFIFFFIPLALTLVAFVILLALDANITVQSNYWEVEGYRLKLALANTPERKMLVVAGSNAYFGIKAETLEKATGIRTVNMGMQASLSFDFISSLIKRVLRPGDVVLLPLEYSYYGDVYSGIQQRTNTLQASVVLSLQPSYFFTQPVTEWLTSLRHVTFERLWEGVESHFYAPRDSMTYRIAALNNWGDNTKNYRTADSPAYVRANLAEELNRGLPRFDLHSGRIHDIERFIEWAKDNGVLLIAAFPNTLDALPFQGAAFAQLRKQIVDFWATHQVDFVDDPVSATFDWGRALDTPYHQTLEGAAVRSSELADNICKKTIGLCAPRFGAHNVRNE